MKHYTFENAAVCLAGVDAAREFLAPILKDRPRELMVVALCDDSMRLMQLLNIPGSKDEVHVPVAELMRRAVSIECSGIILAHNHPSGMQRPSEGDVALTLRIQLTAEAMDITLLDHLIFNHGPVFSFRQAGLI